MNKNDVINNISAKYDYFSREELDKLYDEALYDYLSYSFPFDKSIVEMPETHKRDYMWVQKRIIDLIERLGVGHLQSYKENGMSYDFGMAGISQYLISELISKAGNVGGGV